jgi:predicted GIY-YIG superfamily endonuclease
MERFVENIKHSLVNLDLPKYDRAPTLSGAYVLLHIKTGKLYVGSTGNIAQRLRKHLTMLRSNRHPNEHLQLAYNDDIRIEIQQIAITENKDQAFDVEQRLLDLYSVKNVSMFNVATDARHSAKGLAISEEHREAGRRARVGLKRSPETIERQRIAGLKQLAADPELPGRLQLALLKCKEDPSWMEKRLQSCRNRRHSPETIEKLRLNGIERAKDPTFRDRLSSARKEAAERRKSETNGKFDHQSEV